MKTDQLRADFPDQPDILVVEDEVPIRNVARITLEREGYFVLMPCFCHISTLVLSTCCYQTLFRFSWKSRKRSPI
jgi:hypothetical protein